MPMRSWMGAVTSSHAPAYVFSVRTIELSMCWYYRRVVGTKSANFDGLFIRFRGYFLFMGLKPHLLRIYSTSRCLLYPCLVEFFDIISYGFHYRGDPLFPDDDCSSCWFTPGALERPWLGIHADRRMVTLRFMPSMIDTMWRKHAWNMSHC